MKHFEQNLRSGTRQILVKKVSEVDQNSGEILGKSEIFSLDMSTVEQNDNFE